MSTQRPVTISVDLMGGDNAPWAIVDGLDMVCEKHPDIRFVCFGNMAMIAPIINKRPKLRAACTMRHSDEAISSAEKPSQALRKGRNSSMYQAIDAVKRGEADAVISAGNTGALMAMSKICLGMIAGVYRPAIIAQMPTLIKNKIVTVLDLGANTEANSDTLVQFALMGSVYISAISDVQRPKVGLLNIGEEDLKGRDEIKAAAAYLRENAESLPFDYDGFVEGNDITKGKFDVVVTDGFTGNVTLKTLEGTVKLIIGILKNLIKESFIAKVCAILAYPMLYKMAKKADFRLYSGGMFIGVDGISVKTHGRSDALGIYYGVMHAVKLVNYDVVKIIKEQVESCNLIR